MTHHHESPQAINGLVTHCHESCLSQPLTPTKSTLYTNTQKFCALQNCWELTLEKKRERKRERKDKEREKWRESLIEEGKERKKEKGIKKKTTYNLTPKNRFCFLLR